METVTLAVLDLRTRRNRNQKIFIAHWLVPCQNQSRDRIFWFWYLLVCKSHTVFVFASPPPHTHTQPCKLVCVFTVQKSV